MTKRTATVARTTRETDIRLTLAIDGQGRYTVETDEGLLPAFSLTAYRRLATWLRLPALAADGMSVGGRTQVAAVDPIELEAALARDRE